MKRLWPGALAALALALVACGADDLTPVATGESTTSATAESTTEVECPGSWPVRQLPPGEANEWFAGGVPRLTEAKTPAEAQAILLEDWYEPGKADPEILAGMAYETLEEQVPTTDLVDGGCISQRGVTLAYQLEGAIKTGTTELGEVPAEGVYNTGAQGPQGEITQAEFPGITGDRRAVKVTLNNGHTFWVLVRCGNIGSIRSGHHPVGPTDQPPVEPPPTHPPPTHPPTQPPPSGKDPAFDPQVRGNTTPQETKTQPSAGNQQEVEERQEQPVDVGNGIPETSTPRQTPAPTPPPSTGPAPAPPSGPGTDQGVIPEPTEPATPADEAPEPDDPSEGQPAHKPFG